MEHTLKGVLESVVFLPAGDRIVCSRLGEGERNCDSMIKVLDEGLFRKAKWMAEISTLRAEEAVMEGFVTALEMGLRDTLLFLSCVDGGN